MGGDLLSLNLHFVFWTFILIMIEVGLGKKIKDLYIAVSKRTFPSYDETLKIDEDVEAEDRRVNDENEPGFEPD